MSLLDFNHTSESPHVATPAVIAIATRWFASHGEMTRWTLHGSYRLAEPEAEAIAAEPLQRALCLTITSGPDFDSFNLVGPQLCFADDETREGGAVRGHFNADLTSLVELEPYQRCFLVVSLGSHTSNVLAVAPDNGEGGSA